jgi:hypothetical protein
VPIVIDISVEKKTGQDSAISVSLRKSRSMGEKRLLRRSFDGDMGSSPPPQSTIPNDGKEKEKKEDAAEADQEEDAPIDPSIMLRNKAAPALKPKPRIKSFLSSGNGGALVASSRGGFQAPSFERRHSSSGLEGKRRISNELSFSDRMESIGCHIIEIEPDGNCLFSATAHQLYLDPSRHFELRTRCVEHMAKHRNRFEVFCTANFDQHLKRMAMEGTWASELEIRAMEEMEDRIFCIYSSNSKEAKPTPMNTNFDEVALLANVPMIKLTYHGNHYNSVFDERCPLPLEASKTKNVLLNSRLALWK